MDQMEEGNDPNDNVTEQNEENIEQKEDGKDDDTKGYEDNSSNNKENDDDKDKNEEDMDQMEKDNDPKDNVTEQNEENIEQKEDGNDQHEEDDDTKGEKNDQDDATTTKSITNGEKASKSEPHCVEGINTDKECKENAQSWCGEQKCEIGLKCQYKMDKKSNKCCQKYVCKSKKHEMKKQQDINKKLEAGETIVHYTYRGNPDLPNILRPHHCNRTSICPALVDKGICEDSNMDCSTEFSCQNSQCKCIVTTSCNSEQEIPLLNTNHINDLLIYGAARIAMEKRDKLKCEMSLCSSGEISEASDKICNGEPIRSCKSELKCKEECSCMINIDCEKQDNSGKVSGGKDDRGDNRMEQETQDGNGIESEENNNYDKHRADRDYEIEGAPLPPLMYTDKVTMYIGRDSQKKFSDKKWHHKAEKKCQKISGRFDLGCIEQKRAAKSHVFCMASYCVCYIQYEKCSGIKKIVEEIMDTDTAVEGENDGDDINEDNDNGDEKTTESNLSHEEEHGDDYEDG